MRALFLLLLGLGFLTGCAKQLHPQPAPAAPSAPAANLKARLDAALGITFSSERDQALAAVARDAAQIGHVMVVKSAVSRIVFSSARDEAASECAGKLAEIGQVEDANQVARLITFSSTRDATLKKIATGKR